MAVNGLLLLDEVIGLLAEEPGDIVERNTTEKRAPLWCFEQLGTVRYKLCL